MERHSELRSKALFFLLLLWALWFLNLSARSIFSLILPLIEDEFMIGHARASSIFVSQSIGYALGSVFFVGFYSGRFGYKKSITLSLTITSFALFLASFIKAFTAFYVFSFFIGIAAGIYLPSVIPLITEYFTENRWNRSIAIHDSGAPISVFLTPFIILFILQFSTWRGALVVFAVLSLMGALIFYLISDEIKIAHTEKMRLKNLFKNRSLWAMVIIWGSAAGGNMGLYSIVPLYLTKELSLSIQDANSLLGMSRIGGIAVAVLCGFLVDRINLRKTMFVTLFLAGVFTVLTGLSSTRFIGFLLFFEGFLVTGFFPLAVVSVTKMFGKEIRGMAAGIILALTYVIGAGIIPYLIGFSADLLSFRFGISLLGIFISLSSLLIFSLKGL